jgi:hypothetical protein
MKQTPSIQDFLPGLSKVSLLQCLLFGEAEGESIDGIVGVGNVVRNRVKHPKWGWGDDWKPVMLKPEQFECFDPGNPRNQPIMDSHKVWHSDTFMRMFRLIAFGIINDYLPDNVCGANHYHAQDSCPYWAEGEDPVKIIGRHLFYLL